MSPSRRDKDSTDKKKLSEELLNPESYWTEDATFEKSEIASPVIPPESSISGSDDDEIAIVIPKRKTSLPPNPKSVSSVPELPLLIPEKMGIGKKKEASFSEVFSDANQQPNNQFTASKSRLDWYERIKIFLAVLLTIIVFAFLGWWIIGQHASEDENSILQSNKIKVSEPSPKEDPIKATPKTDTFLASPKATVGRIMVDSIPSAASVYLNGQKQGTTPLTFEKMPINNPIEIKVELSGYQAKSEVLQPNEKETEKKLHFVLEKLGNCPSGTGWIYVSSSPSKAEVELDQKLMEKKTPVIIDSVCASVSHRLRVSANGYQTSETLIEINPNEVRNINIVLKK